jgi:type IV pilus assembly protein PilW
LRQIEKPPRDGCWRTICTTRVYGRYVSELAVPAAMPDPCAATLATLEAGMALPVQGYDAPATVPPELAPCLASANLVPGTDILVVRRARPVRRSTSPPPR